MCKRYQNMESATLYMGYGKLTRTNDIRHGGGITDNDSRVWLPILCDPTNNWYNMYSNNNSSIKEFIIQIANNEQAEKDFYNHFSSIPFPDEATHVIIRQNFDENRKNYEFDDIGSYCPILINMDKYTSIHAKVNSTSTTGKALISNNNRMRWISGFASTEAEAYEKFDKLTGGTLKVLREIKI